MALNLIEHLLILASVVTGCVSITTFVSLVDILKGIVSSTVGLKSCTITGGIEKYNLIIKKKKKKQNKIV